MGKDLYIWLHKSKKCNLKIIKDWKSNNKLRKAKYLTYKGLASLAYEHSFKNKDKYKVMNKQPTKEHTQLRNL